MRKKLSFVLPEKQDSLYFPSQDWITFLCHEFFLVAEQAHKHLQFEQSPSVLPRLQEVALVGVSYL